MIVDKRTREQIFSPENYRTSYDNFQFGMIDTLGAVAGDTLMHNPVPALERLKDSLYSDRGPTILPEEANKKYGLDGAITFDAPVTETYARGMMELKQKEQRNKEIINKGSKGVFPGAAKFAVGLGVSMTDPINIASAFIPGGPLLKGMGMTKLAASNTARAVVAKGALGGFAGAAALEPIPYFSAKKYQLDYDLTDSLLNVAFGGIMGGGIAGAGVFFKNMRGGSAVDSTLKQLAHEKQINILGESLNSVFDDRLPEIRTHLVSDAKQKLRASHLTDEEFLAAIPDGFAERVQKAAEIKTRFSEAPKDLKQALGYQPETLSQFIKKTGGIQDTGGELKSQDIQLPGLIRKEKAKLGTDKGVVSVDNQIDAVRQRVFDEGYFPNKTDYDQITNDELFESIKNDLAGKKVYKASDREAINNANAVSGSRQSLEEAGFNENMSVGQIFDELMAQDFESRQSRDADVFNEMFPDRLADDQAYNDQLDRDMFLVPDDDMVRDFELETTAEKQLIEMQDEIRNNLDSLSDADRNLYDGAFAEIDEEIDFISALKKDASNLATCLLAG